MPDSWQEVEGAVLLTEKPVQFNRLKISAGVDMWPWKPKACESDADLKSIENRPAPTGFYGSAPLLRTR